MKTIRSRLHSICHPAALSLILIRHALAQERELFAITTGESDRLRPLTPKGMERTRIAALSLAELLGDVDQLLSSPYLRASQTAELLAESLTIEQYTQTDLLVPEADVTAQVQGLKAMGLAGIVVLVGHEPNLSELISHLLCPQAAPVIDVEMKKGSVCALHFEQGLAETHASLLWLLTQPQLRAMQKDS